MKVNVILFCLLFIFSACESQKEASSFDYEGMNPVLKQMVANLAENDYIGTKSIGRTQEPSEAYANRRALMDSASEEELVRLLQHPDGEVVATAYEALTERGYPHLKSVLMELLDSKKTVNYILGDVYYRMPLIEYLYVHVLGYEMPGEDLTYRGENQTDIGLTAVEMGEVVKTIIDQR